VLRGGALVRLADLRVRQGRYEEAQAQLDDVQLPDPGEAARPRAAIHLAIGEPEVAREILEAALGDADGATGDTVPLLALLVEVLLTLDETDEAHRRFTQLEAVARTTSSAYVRATAALARGRLCLATGGDDPHACLRQALGDFTRANVPLEAASVRLQLAELLAADRPAAAVAEARRALETFERLKAARHADAAAALLRSLGVRSPAARGDEGGAGVLSRREAEVLALLGEGLSNPEVAARLFISRKTVEHHVSNILAKLHLRSRAEAAAHAVRHGAAAGPGPAPE
jgi:DNA-binding CsgD family transcriptional regulator